MSRFSCRVAFGEISSLGYIERKAVSYDDKCVRYGHVDERNVNWNEYSSQD